MGENAAACILHRGRPASVGFASVENGRLMKAVIEWDNAIAIP